MKEIHQQPHQNNAQLRRAVNPDMLKEDHHSLSIGQKLHYKHGM